jgi:cellulose synthase/poly-beta-1,6-N-acetylglucosamine synthase-like glycosyltransferase
MKVQLTNKNIVLPENSVILVDWSCRESFHILQYLNNQAISREKYEIIWIEYYSRQGPEIEAELKKCDRLGKPPIVDQWIVMGMPDHVCYHKHLMYNVGILASRGKIVTLCDSDAMVGPTFIESIIKNF